MNRLLGKGRIIVAALLALTIAAAVALTAGPATAAVSSCNAGNAKLYLPTSSYPYYRLHTSYRPCYLEGERMGWYTYSMRHWRCGEFNCHSFWLRYKK